MSAFGRRQEVSLSCQHERKTTVSTQETAVHPTMRSMNARPSRLTSSFQTRDRVSHAQELGLVFLPIRRNFAV